MMPSGIKLALTPSLSPGEREMISAIVRQPISCDFAEGLRMVLPLLGGEGRGEGGLLSNSIKFFKQQSLP